MAALTAPTPVAMGWRDQRRWIVAGVGAPAVAALVPVALRPGDASHASLAVLMLLVGECLWAAAFLLVGGRGALLIAVVGVAGLSAIQLPVPDRVPYRWRQALYRPDQAIQLHVPVDARHVPASPALRVLAEPHLVAAQPAFALETEMPLATTRWACPFAAGRQWLELPVPASAIAGKDELPVTLRLTGQPSREGDYLVVYARNESGDFLVELAESAATGPEGPTIRCAIADSSLLG